jgi:hypothetical protein
LSPSRDFPLPHSSYLLLVLYRDIMSIYKEPPPGMFVVPDTVDMTKVGNLMGEGAGELCKNWAHKIEKT